MPTLPAPRYFMLRVRRDGPLVPAKLWWCDHDPADETNKLDRGRCSVFPRAEIAGEEADPELLLDRLGIWRERGDMPLLAHQALAALHRPEQLWPRPVGHWAHCEAITRTEYEYRLLRLRWAEQHRPAEPALRPRRAIDPAQMPLPDFSRENSL